jgi:hypothetical protein
LIDVTNIVSVPEKLLLQILERLKLKYNGPGDLRDIRKGEDKVHITGFAAYLARNEIKDWIERFLQASFPLDWEDRE